LVLATRLDAEAIREIRNGPPPRLSAAALKLPCPRPEDVMQT
jgi:hypothetical protein